ncbi:unnamed protein product [Porites evermanni]|uniref:Uncharacterized protein n=1 Tax=Porites evermanni TaxID=104178 RepID=A0ABN8PF62_9CNID|nr:unnamed protein product [Porites evermanni]
MIDVTSVLSRLSVQFQKDDITINEVVCGIEKSITELKKLEKGGVHYQGLCNRYSEQNGKLVCGKDNKQELTLTHKGTNPMLSFQKLLNGISSYLEKRFDIAKGKNDSASGATEIVVEGEEEEEEILPPLPELPE